MGRQRSPSQVRDSWTVQCLCAHRMLHATVRNDRACRSSGGARSAGPNVRHTPSIIRRPFAHLIRPQDPVVVLALQAPLRLAGDAGLRLDTQASWGATSDAGYTNRLQSPRWRPDHGTWAYARRCSESRSRRHASNRVGTMTRRWGDCDPRLGVPGASACVQKPRQHR